MFLSFLLFKLIFSATLCEEVKDVKNKKSCKGVDTSDTTSTVCCYIDVTQDSFEHQKACVEVDKKSVDSNMNGIITKILNGESEISFVYHQKVDTVHSLNCNSPYYSIKNIFLFFIIFILI